jgi:hypothetical protein
MTIDREESLQHPVQRAVLRSARCTHILFASAQALEPVAACLSRREAIEMTCSPP